LGVRAPERYFRVCSLTGSVSVRANLHGRPGVVQIRVAREAGLTLPERMMAR